MACHEDPYLAPPAEEWRDWSALPGDVLWLIFDKLPHTDILRGAELVCAPWRRVAVGEPLLWRRIDLAAEEDRISRRDGDEDGPVGWRTRVLARAAVDRSAGACESFRGPVDVYFLPYLIDNAPSMRSLHVTSGLRLAGRDVAGLMKKLPLLERLELSRGVFSFRPAERLALVHRRPSLELFDARGHYASDAEGRRYMDKIVFQRSCDCCRRHGEVQMPKELGLQNMLVGFFKRLGRMIS